MLVAHSYGGMVISNVDAGAGEIAGLVYVNAFAPDAGESAFALSEQLPGSHARRCAAADSAKRRHDGPPRHPGRFHAQFCADIPAPEAARMAVTQRPVTQEALVEPSGELSLWKELPSWFLMGGEDRNIPPALQHFMAERADARPSGSISRARRTRSRSHTLTQQLS